MLLAEVGSRKLKGVLVNWRWKPVKEGPLNQSLTTRVAMTTTDKGNMK